MTTYGTLRADIDEWTSRDDLSGSPAVTAIRMVEAEIARRVRHTSQEFSTTITVTGQSFNLETPTDFRVQKIRSLSLNISGVRPQLEEHAPAALRASVQWTLQGTPTKFAQEGCNLLFGPAPEPSPGVEMFMVYFQRYAAMTQDSDTNILLQENYDLYLAGALKHAFRLAQDLEQSRLYGADFELILQQVKLDQNRRRRSSNYLPSARPIAP